MTELNKFTDDELRRLGQIPMPLKYARLIAAELARRMTIKTPPPPTPAASLWDSLKLNDTGHWVSPFSLDTDGGPGQSED